MFQKRHYEFIARALGESGAGKTIVGAFCVKFQADNPNFNWKKFEEKVYEYSNPL